MLSADRKCLRTVIKTFLEEQERFLSRINEVVCENKTLDGLHMDMVNCVEVPTDHAAVRVSHCRTIVAQHKLLRKHRLGSEHCFLIAEREQSNQLSQEEILLELESMTLLLEKVRSEQARILRERDSILAEHSQVFKSSIKVLKER